MNNYIKDNMHNKNIGKYGEDIAAKYLISLGYTIITRNYLTKKGEIDIIAKDKKEIVFVEVKTRLSKKFGEPCEAVTDYKIKHFVEAAKYYVYYNKLYNSDLRFDVIEVFKSENNRINHFKQII